MKYTFLEADGSVVIVGLSIMGFIIAITIIYYFFRWLFAVDKRVKQNESIIRLLTLIAKKDGATENETLNAIFNSNLKDE